MKIKKGKKSNPTYTHRHILTDTKRETTSEDDEKQQKRKKESKEAGEGERQGRQ